MNFQWDMAFALECLPLLLEGFALTVGLSIAGMGVALVLGLLAETGRRQPFRPLAHLLNGLVEFIRSTPLLVQLYVWYFVLPDFGITLSLTATAILGLGIHYAAYTAEIYRAGINGVPEGQWEAGTTLGFTPRQIFTRIILPQAFRPIIPPLGNRFIALLKDSVMLSAISVMEVLNVAKDIGSESFRYLEPFTLVAVLFLAVSLLAAGGVRLLENRYVTPRTH